MNTLMKYAFITSLALPLTACVTDQKMKVQFEPMLPVPFLVVPDEGATNNPNNNYQRYEQPQPQPYKDHHGNQHRHGNEGRNNQGQERYDEREYGDDRY